MILLWLFLFCCVLLAFEGTGGKVPLPPGEHYRADGSKIYREGEQ
jgi:hypothetical protein